MNRMPLPFRCMSWWFIIIWLCAFGVALWLGLQIPKKAPQQPTNVTIVFFAFTRDGLLTKAYLVQIDSRPWGPVATGTGCQLTRPAGTTAELIFSKDQYISSDDIRLQVVWRETKDFLQWIKEKFPIENSLTPEAHNRILQHIVKGTAGNKQYYPIVLSR